MRPMHGKLHMACRGEVVTQVIAFKAFDSVDVRSEKARGGLANRQKK
jgi:hypothetical protein